MQYNFLEHAIVFVCAFFLLELGSLAWCYATSRLARSGAPDRLAIAVSRWNGGYSLQAFVMWQVAAFGSYYVAFGQA